MSTPKKRHGAVLRGLRLECDPPMRQGALAERVNVTPSAISQIENGSRGLSIDLLCRAADVLACYLPMTAQQIIVAVATGEVDAPAATSVPTVDAGGQTHE